MLLLIGVAIGIAAMLAAWVRRGGSRWRTGAVGALLTALSVAFLLEGRTPLLSPGDPTTSHGAVDQLIAGLWWVLAASGLSFVVQYTLGHDGRSRQSRLMSDLLSAGVYLGALLAVMDFVLKLPLSGLVATSGIVAVVLGLALQSTLADLFSGIAVGIEQPFRLGDSISLGDGIEGSVSQINWRSIRISTDDDDVAIVPNSTVAKARIVNRSFPTSRRGAAFGITTSTAADPERVQELIAQALLLTPAVLEKPAPSINLVRLGMKTSTHKVHFFVESPKQLGQAKSVALCHVRSLLLRAGLLERPGDPHHMDRAPPYPRCGSSRA
ncbi:mechanosensitive ion channel family protein [Sphingomonas sp. NFR15]|uniref:mechanosensitive ion channel family protein n=1 Tax=Sphingomonas sp. NFR15 TaxID=1566282 RepID=UPI00088AC441|nr:mechanosensitive ion channel domain-containing protein [Sphingomonas sp. NFR15]SDA36928.1 Mechanosensitive ion channel [Sphingomonas sp. NFR15]